MKISVITVCFNSRDTIAETLRSIAEQNHPDIEHIVVDGASRDDTLAVIAATPNRITHLVSEPDRGIYDAMNKGLGLASGEMIGFLNADDVYADKHVLSRVAEIMEHENLDALFGNVEYFRPEHPARIVRRYCSARFSPDQIASGWMPAHPALFLRRQVYQSMAFFAPTTASQGTLSIVPVSFVVVAWSPAVFLKRLCVCALEV